MSRQLKHSFLNWLLSVALVVSTLGIFVTTVTPVSAQTGRPGVTTTVSGTRSTVGEILQQGKATLPPTTTANGVGEPSISFHSPVVPSQVTSGAQPNVSAETLPAGLQPMSPQAVTDTIAGPSVNTSSAFIIPPDTMGAIGPYQFGFTESSIFSFVSKTPPHNPVFQAVDQTFWGNLSAGQPSDPKVRYDRALGVWYISEIDPPNGNNDILFAVSSGPDLSNVNTTWTKFKIVATGGVGSGASEDEDCFVHFDTMGIDQNAVYIGGDVTNNQQAHGGPLPCDQGTPGTFQHTNLYVITKTAITAALSGSTAPNITVTSFYDLSQAGFNPAPFTPEPADDFDTLSTGYVVGPDMAEEISGTVSHLDVLPVLTPGTSPTLGTVTQINLPEVEHLALRNLTGTGPITPNNVLSNDPARGMDDLDDRMLSATIRNGQLWTAQNLAVDINGNSNVALSNLDRDGERWYEININSMTITQAGTVSDTTTAHQAAPCNAGSSCPLNYWMGSIMVSGQGDVAMGMNYGNRTTTLQGVAVGRLASDSLNTMRGFTSFVSSQNFAYDDKTVNGQTAQAIYNRWGDFSYTSLDPCDDMTMWTVQEFVGTNHGTFNGNQIPTGWQVEAAKLQAPAPPSIPASLGNVAYGQAAFSLNIVGTSSNGTGFYDNPASADVCRSHLTATVTNNVKVTNITFTDPTHITLTLDTTKASPGGTATLNIFNPDGQAVSTQFYVTSVPADTFGVYRVSGGKDLFLLRNTNTSGFADIAAAFTIGSQPYPVVGNWSGSGFDTIGSFDRSNGLFSLLNNNVSATTPDEQLVLGVPQDEPIGGVWTVGATHDGVGVFRPSNGLLLFRDALSTGFANYVMVLGVPGDQGLAGKWNPAIARDGPGVYRPSIQYFLLSDTICGSCSVFANYGAQLGNPGDSPVVGDWMGQGSAGIGVFRPSNGLILLRNELTTGFAEIVIVFGIPNDIPLAGHWSAQSVSSAPSRSPQILVNGPQVPPTSAPNVSSLGG